MSRRTRHLLVLAGLAVGAALVLRFHATGASALPRGGTRTPRTTVRARPTDVARAAEPPRSAEVASTPAPLSADRALTRFRERLARAAALGEHDRGARDDLRCEIDALLHTADVATLVRALTAEELASEFGCQALARWAETDPGAAALWLGSQPAPSAEETSAVARALAHAPDELATISAALRNLPWRDALLAECSSVLGATEPARAVALAQSLPPGDVRSHLLISLADDHARQAPAAAARWITAEPNPALRQDLIATAAAAQSSADPLGAVDWTLRVAGPDGLNDPALQRIIEVWSRYAPARAARFAASAGLGPDPLPAPGGVD